MRQAPEPQKTPNPNRHRATLAAVAAVFAAMGIIWTCANAPAASRMGPIPGCGVVAFALLAALAAAFFGFLNTTSSYSSQLEKSEGELRQQRETLRATNEELQSQSTELARQQEELRQANEQLEERNSELVRRNREIEQQRHQIEEARRELESKAQQLQIASKYKSEFLANMSHELRTPLNSLLILAKQLQVNREGNLTPDQIEAARVIESGGSVLLTIINDILDLSKVEAGKLNIEHNVVRVDSMVTRLRELFQPVAEEKELSFEIRFADNIPPSIITDALRVEQILRNLLSNAFKFTLRGGVTLHVDLINRSDSASAGGESQPTTAADPLNDAWLRFSVTDTGIGIPPERQAEVFESFQQGDGSTSRRFGGTGLGLTISRELCRLLGGSIDFDSQRDQGSTFRLLLPIAPFAEEPQSNTQSAPLIPPKHLPILSRPFPDMTGFELLERLAAMDTDGVPPVVIYTGMDLSREEHRQLREYTDSVVVKGVDSPKRLLDEVSLFLHRVESDLTAEQRRVIRLLHDPEELLRGRTVLLADDDMRNLFALTSVLEQAGLTVIKAENGDEALQVLDEHSAQISLIIMDVMMPVMDGLEAISVIRSDERHATLPIIALTAKVTLDDRQHCLAAGATDYLTKPVDVDKLLSLMKVWMFSASAPSLETLTSV